MDVGPASLHGRNPTWVRPKLLGRFGVQHNLAARGRVVLRENLCLSV